MSLYSSYADADLEAEIADLKAKIIATGKSDQAGVKVIAGEGRRMEFFGQGGGTNVTALEKLLRAAETEWALRNGGSGIGGSAIGVNF